MYWIVTSPKDQLLAGHESGTIGFDVVEPEQQNTARGDFVIVYSSLETTGGAPVDAFTSLRRMADRPGQMPESPWAINRRIAFFDGRSYGREHPNRACISANITALA